MKMWKEVRLGLETDLELSVARPRTGKGLRQLAAGDEELRCPLEMFQSMLLYSVYCILLCLPTKLGQISIFSSTL